MLPNIAKLIIFLIINGLIRISGQELAQRTARTFENTQFDLDRNLPFDSDTTIESESSNISRRKSPISVKVQPATTILPYLQTTAIIFAQEPIYVKPKSSKSKFQHEYITNASYQAPRAKPYHTIPINMPEFIQSEQHNPASQVSITNLLPQQNSPSFLSLSSPPSLLLIATTPSSPIPITISSTASGSNTDFQSAIPIRQQTSSHSQWFNDTIPSFECSQDFQQIATEFQRKFPPQTTRDIKEKRLAEVIKQRLIDCDHKSKSDYWQNLIELVTKVKISPSEEEGCNNGLIQERIACVNLLSYTCQFIKRDYTFRLLPARVIIQEARLIEDGAAKCAKVIRLIKKEKKPK
ncbi:Halomucin [Dirofilaria immitis]